MKQVYARINDNTFMANVTLIFRFLILNIFLN